jgi:hypothetical protein
MGVEQQLSYEARARARQTIVAALAGALIVGAAALQLSGPHAKVDELTLDLLTEARRQGLDLVGAVVNALGFLALAWTLSYLWQLTRARNPQLQPFIRWLAVAGGVIAGLSAFAYQVVLTGKAAEFADHGAQTYVEAHALTSGGLVSALPALAQLGSLLLTAGIIWISLSAMRVGLLTRFLGYVGVFAGILVLFPIGTPVPVVQGFWLLAVALLISGRWPTGVPAAWRTGRAEPWPSAAGARAQSQGKARESRAGGSPRPAGAAGMARSRPAGGAARAGMGERPARRGLLAALQSALIGARPLSSSLGASSKLATEQALEAGADTKEARALTSAAARAGGASGKRKRKRRR